MSLPFFYWMVIIGVELLEASMLDISASVDLENVLHITDERYLSVTMGPTVIRHNWGNFNTRYDDPDVSFHVGLNVI